MSSIYSTESSALFFRLLLSHLCTDFLLQPTSWVIDKQAKKHRSPFLYWHSLIAGILAYIFSGEWQSLYLIPFISITHGCIDWIKLRYGSKHPLSSFLADQAIHILVLLLAWLYMTDNRHNFWILITLALTNNKIVAVLTGYVLCTTPIGFIIGMATRKWLNDIQQSTDRSPTLNDAGRWIGIAERVLIFTLVLVDQYEAIGFLIAAKSLLRFQETKTAAPKQAEYVLIGTLLSFGLSILLGLLIKLSVE